MSLSGKHILLIISGGIAAYKSLELIRLLRKQDAHVRCILTHGGSQFVTPMSVAALSENTVYTDLWSLKDESEMGHIRLSREADLIVVAPASASMIAKMANGLADDLASTTLLANDKSVIIAPAMNGRMWDNPATQHNITRLRDYGIIMCGPDNGDMACGETGFGRMSEPEDILQTITHFFKPKILQGLTALVTSGPTYEAIDPVRFIGNRSSGRQGHAIAQSLSDFGADVTLVTGPVKIPDPQGVNVIHVTTALQMADICANKLPVDIAVCASAVADWRVQEPSKQKFKKHKDLHPFSDLSMVENPDILSMISKHKDKRPKIVVGFAAETDNLVDNAKKKLEAKGCDMILANDVSHNQVFDKSHNHIHCVMRSHGSKTILSENWDLDTKQEHAQKLVSKIYNEFINTDNKDDVRYDNAAE